MEMAAQDPAAAESSIRRQCEADLEAMARDIEASLDEWTEDTPESDRALMRDPENRAMLRENNRQAVLRGADGLVQELLLNYTAPWGFRLEDIAAPVFIWHGDRDPQVPVEVAHRMAERIPQCTLTIYPGEGHMIDVAHADDILRTLGPVA
jgi:pimeloyl-ACP methyl ester carboxylesterase